MTAADWTLTALSLPRPPPSEARNLSACKTVNDHPDLFKIVTPVKVDNLECLLVSHPNCPFVESVLEGLREGFWLWASTTLEGYPETHDESKLMSLTGERKEFLLGQVEQEQRAKRMSVSFGETLLPGMYCMPHYIVPKPHLSG